MKLITPAELHAVLLAQPEITLLDVRTPVEYEELHIAHARNIPLTALNPRQLFETGKLSQVEPVYLLCRTGARAKLAAQQFTSHGFENTVLLEGGTEAWSNASLPVERGEGSIIGLERQVRIAAGALVHRPLGVRRRRPSLCGHHRLVRHGAAVSQNALE